MSAGALPVVDAGATSVVRVEYVGRVSYARGLELQQARHAEVLGWREAAGPTPVGVVLVLEHDPPVITVSRRQGAMAHLVATPERVAAAGVEIAETDRGGDITYHGPGQVVAYPILDLNRLGLGLHAYMRMLEQVVMDVCAGFGVATVRDEGATGVWTRIADGGAGAKIAAMGIRVRRWVSLHGLALNVTTDLSHFELIVPCGLVGRSVTSLERELGIAPAVDAAQHAVGAAIVRRAAEALAAREGGGVSRD